jgi:hypothetical protein
MFKEIVDIVETLENAPNEGTDSPWWIIIDPRQNKRNTVSEIATSIDGPFFNRKDADEYLESRRYDYGPNAKVFCKSGYSSKKYSNFYKAIKRSKGK